MSDSNHLKSWMLLIAPSATMAIGYGWALARSQLDDWYGQRKARLAFEEAQTTLQNILADPQITPAHRKETRESLEALQRDFINNKTTRFRATLRIKP